VVWRTLLPRHTAGTAIFFIFQEFVMSADLTPAISRFPVPELDALPEDLRARILAVQERSGFIPNVFLTLAHRPDEFRAFFAYHDALMDKPGKLSKAEREMIVVATSNLNQCQYCVVAHGAILRIRAQLPQGGHQRTAKSHARLCRQGVGQRTSGGRGGFCRAEGA
jgi:AhpD family alkylhydroperoxidase